MSKNTMSDIDYSILKRGDPLLYVRIIPNIGYYEILDVKIVSKYADYCTVTEGRTKQTYIIGRNSIADVLYINMKLALQYLNKQKEKYKDIVIAKE